MKIKKQKKIPFIKEKEDEYDAVADMPAIIDLVEAELNVNWMEAQSMIYAATKEFPIVLDNGTEIWME